MNFRKIITDQDWSDALTLRNSFMWNGPITIEEAKVWHENQKAEGTDERFIGEVNGELVCYVCAMKVVHDASGRRFRVSAYVDRDHAQAGEYQRMGLLFAEKLCREHGAKEVIQECRSENRWTESLMSELGYKFEMRFPVSSLDTTTDNFEARQLPDGFEILSYAQYRDRTPETWEHDLWRLEMDIAADLPLPFPFVESSLESFKNDLQDPTVDHNSLFLMLVNGYPAGLSQLYKTTDPRYGSTGLTGVRREFRRRHIATMLKLHGAKWCYANGMEEVFTDNEENNPMFQLNLKLGFKPKFDNLSYSKVLDELS